jgi:hypothetical protein
MRVTQKLLVLVGCGLLMIACGPVETFETEELGQVSQELSLGSTLAIPAAWGSTCGLNNGVTPTCAPSSASDMSYTWTAPSSGTFTFSTTGSNFSTVLQVAPYGAPLSPLGCNSNGSSSSLSLSLTAGQQLIITIDGYASLCGDYKLNISKNCTSSCTTPPPCRYSPGVCTVNGTCSYTSMCDSSEVCSGGSCVPRCLIDPRYPC